MDNSKISEMLSEDLFETFKSWADFGYKLGASLSGLTEPLKPLDNKQLKKAYEKFLEEEKNGKTGDIQTTITELDAIGRKAYYIALYAIFKNPDNRKKLPYFAEVLEEYQQWKDLDIDELQEPLLDEKGNQLVDNMIDFLAKQLEKKPSDRLKTTAKKVSELNYPIDKVNFKVWSLFESGNIANVPIAVEKAGSKTELNIYYAINFDELGNDITITRKLQPYDKRTYVALAALFDAGNEVVTLSQIYHAMGFTGTPGKVDKDKINESITKMRSAQIKIDNTQESKHYNYPQFIYDGSLLPSERITAVINGSEVDSAIHLFREPPLITFAKERNQITTLDIKLLQSPISKTNLNLQIEGYLIERIARAKTGTGNPRILYQTILEQLNSNDITATNLKNIKKRLPEKIQKYLDYYVKCKSIKKYTTDNAGIIVYL